MKANIHTSLHSYSYGFKALPIKGPHLSYFPAFTPRSSALGAHKQTLQPHLRQFTSTTMASNSNSAEQIQKELDPAAPTASPSAKDQIKPNQSKPRRNNRRGGGGQSRDVLVSKALSKLLRHDAEKHKLKLDEHGFARVDEVVRCPHLED